VFMVDAIRHWPVKIKHLPVHPGGGARQKARSSDSNEDENEYGDAQQKSFGKEEARDANDCDSDES